MNGCHLPEKKETNINKQAIHNRQLQVKYNRNLIFRDTSIISYTLGYSPHFNIARERESEREGEWERSRMVEVNWCYIWSSAHRIHFNMSRT